MSGESEALRPIATRALDYVARGTVVGLGTGRAASAFVEALGERVRDGLDVRGVPTSEATASLAAKVGIPLLSLDEALSLAVTFDGADEVSPDLDLIKGYGGALVREKIVAASSERLIILVGDEKRVDRIGARGRLPVEVVPFARSLCERRLADLGCPSVVRMVEGKPFLTDNLNLILDCAVKSIADPEALERILVGLGFRPCYRYQKYRTLFAVGELQVCLDETPIGCFVELEGAPEAIDRAAERLEVSHLRRRAYGALSGGERQRVLVAKAIASGADLLLFDEPITGLDLPSQARILDVIADHARNGGTVVFSTHHLGEASRADRVLLMAGCVLADGRPEEVLVPELLAEAFGGRMVLGDGTAVVVDEHHHDHETSFVAADLAAHLDHHGHHHEHDHGHAGGSR